MLDPLQPRNTFHQRPDSGAELQFQDFRPVFHQPGHGMQDGGRDRFRVHVHAGQDRCRTERVLQQRCAGQFELPGIKRLRQFAGLTYRADFFRRKGSGQRIQPCRNIRAIQ
jgi:hypothetical protein